MAGLALERRRDVGLMKALGGSVRRIMRFFLAEATAIGFVGGIIGFAIGMLSLAVDRPTRVLGIHNAAPDCFARHARTDGACVARRRASLAAAGPRAAVGDSAGRMMAVLVQVDDISKTFAGVRALDGVSFEVLAGEWIAIMGPSGSGKTTLINILGGLDRPTSGRAIVDGVDVGTLGERELTRYRAEKIGFVFQTVSSRAVSFRRSKT